MRTARPRKYFPLLVGACLSTLAMSATDARAQQSAVGLGTAGSYAVLAGSTVTNTGPTTINGDLGISPGTALTGFPPGTINGATHLADAAAAQAQADLTVAYDDAASRTPASTVTGDLGNQTLAPGVYRSGSSLGLTGTVTLDGQNNADSVFIIQVASALTTASGSSVALINGAQACNVFWQVGSSATLGTTSVFRGNLIALSSISISDGVTVDGRALARNGAVTLINDTISVAQCAAAPDAPTDSGVAPDGASGGGEVPADEEGPPVDEQIPGAPPSGSNPPQLTRSRCVDRSFRASVSGSGIRRVIFLIGGRVRANDSRSPFGVTIRRTGGFFNVNARVSFLDSSPSRTLRLRVKACAAGRAEVGPSRNPVVPPGFAG